MNDEGENNNKKHPGHLKKMQEKLVKKKKIIRGFKNIEILFLLH
jgi:hypothetical protein